MTSIPDNLRSLLLRGAIGLSLAGCLVAAGPAAAQWDEPEGNAADGADSEATASEDDASGEDGEDGDPFAYEEPPAQTSTRVRFGVGLGIGTHASEAPSERTLQKLSSDPFIMGTAFASFEAREPDSIGYGMSLAYRSSIGQSASVSAPPADAAPANFTGKERLVSSAARKQEIIIDGVLRVPFGEEEDAASLPLLIGIGFLGFNTDQEIPVTEYTVFDFHLQPNVRIPIGPAELSLGALGGVGLSVDSGLEDAGYATMGFLYGGQVGLDIMVADPFLIFLDGRFRQTLFSADDGSGNFIDTMVAVTFGAAARF